MIRFTIPLYWFSIKIYIWPFPHHKLTPTELEKARLSYEEFKRNQRILFDGLPKYIAIWKDTELIIQEDKPYEGLTDKLIAKGHQKADIHRFFKITRLFNNKHIT